MVNKRCKYCGKVYFKNKIDAEIALVLALTSNNNRRKERRVYYSEQCKCFHLTSIDY